MFTRDLSKVTEAYVGEQLGLVNPPILLHDVEYNKAQHASDYVIGYPGLDGSTWTGTSPTSIRTSETR